MDVVLGIGPCLPSRHQLLYLPVSCFKCRYHGFERQRSVIV